MDINADIHLGAFVDRTREKVFWAEWVYVFSLFWILQSKRDFQILIKVPVLA